MSTNDDLDERRAELADTIAAAVRLVVEGDPTASIARAVQLVPAAAIASFWHATFDDHTSDDHTSDDHTSDDHTSDDHTSDDGPTLLTTALGASPGAASGELVLSAQAAIDASAAGRDVILVRSETTPDDVLGMQASRGVLTARGGTSSHAAVVARGWGIPAVVGAAELVIGPDDVRIDEHVLVPGTPISIDGRTGEVFLGHLRTTATEAPPELELLLQWADRIRAGARHPVAVRANADLAADAIHARRLGAQGIGLCRTEHMFLADDRLGLMRRFILTDDPDEEVAALAELETAQERDFEALLVAIDPLPVTVRLLDPPLHEFLPELEHLVAAEAVGSLDDDGRRLLAAVRRLHEVNPMIGTRGVRLGVVRPGVYEMQVRALCRAIAAVAAGGRSPRVQVMIPLVVGPAEMRAARSWVHDAVTDAGLERGLDTGLDTGLVPALSVGAMIETPRAALLGGEIAEVSDFLSFGTNDLTQLMFGFSRDDVGSTLLPAYLRAGLLDADPFETVDRLGVGRGIRFAVDAARMVRPDIEIGVCGEQAADPESARFFVECGVDYVSCSPYRLPVARLAVAQALLEQGQVPDQLLADMFDEFTTAPPGRADAIDPIGTTAPTAPTAPTVPIVPIDPDGGGAEFCVLHALRIKGFATVVAVAEIAHHPLTQVQDLLVELGDRGLVRHIAGRDLWQLTPEGTERHRTILPTVRDVAAPGLRHGYDEFLRLNASFKELCARWQLRQGSPNDHTDHAYDTDRIGELADLHARAEPVVAGFAGTVGRFESYRQRLATALTRTTAGETRMFTGLMCGSYHEVWMEMHEDLIQLLDVDRRAEGSF
jgi:phosphoenolpyruvate-protein kinase (PTS system EI component)